MATDIIIADYQNPLHAAALIEVLDAYAQDPMGGNQALCIKTKDKLVGELAKLDSAVTILAFVDGKPAGLVNGFLGFSTFKCKPLLNIHDVTVKAEYRGMGISLQMMNAAQALAQEKGCCKLTLEVLERNIPAQNAYLKLGFTGYELDPKLGKAMFWEKTLE